MGNKHPNKDECLALLKEYHTPEHVMRHCLKVSETAIKIANALNKNGYHLDIELIQAAGLIHDIARVDENHWDIGAKIANDLGYFQEADIIKQHMFYASDPNKEEIEEIDIVCLSDRMVKENLYVGLDNRMQYILDKFKGNPEAKERIEARIKDNKILIQRIESKIGVSIDSLM